MSEKNSSEVAIETLYNLVQNYPAIVEFIVYLGIAIGTLFCYQSIMQYKDRASAGIGLGAMQEKDLLRKATANLFFGVILINLMIFIELTINTLGISGSQYFATDYYSKNDIFESSDGAADVIMYVVWTVNLFGLYRIFRGVMILRGSFINPHENKFSIGLKLIVSGIICLCVKWIAGYTAIWLNLPFVAKWLGMG